MANPAAAANTFLYLASKEHVLINPQKLQQLVYCFYREQLRQGQPKPFQEPFVKGKRGPMLESMDYKFKCFGEGKISALWRNALGQAEIVDLRLTSFPSVKNLRKVWACYKKVPVKQMELLLTKPGSAWDRADTVLRDKDIINEPILTVMRYGINKLQKQER